MSCQLMNLDSSSLFGFQQLESNVDNAFLKILNIALFPENHQHSVALIAHCDHDCDDQNSCVDLPFLSYLVQNRCEVIPLPNSENFVDSATEVLKRSVPNQVLIIPPFISGGDISSEFWEKFSSNDLLSIILHKAVDTLPPGTRVGALLPSSYFVNVSSENERASLLRKVQPLFLIFPDISVHNLGFTDINHSFRMHLIVFSVGKSNEGLVRFFKYSESVGAGVVDDFRLLCEDMLGDTRFGFTVQSRNLSEGALTFERFHPKFIENIEELKRFGGVKDLDHFATVRVGLSRMKIGSHTSVSSCSGCFLLLDGKNILRDGSVNYDDLKHVNIETIENIDAEKSRLLKGDVCMRRIVGRDDLLVLTKIDQNTPKMIASDSVIVLRFRDEVEIAEREVILAFLKSHAPMKWLRAHGIGCYINIGSFIHMPLPKLDKDLRTAIQSLNDAQNTLTEWVDEIEQARSGLFRFHSIESARFSVLGAGRTARNRIEAGKLVDNFDYLVRTRFPFPIASRWRQVMVSDTNLEGYKVVLECAEVVVCYLAHIAMIVAANINCQTKSILDKRLTKTKRGACFGDWIAIISEANSEIFHAIKGDIPFREVLCCWTEKARDAAEKLRLRRNDEAHGRGPKGIKMKRAREEAKNELICLLRVVGFISDYSLIFIEDTAWNSFDQKTTYRYRALMGDHPLTPIETGICGTPELEKNGLYLVDRDQCMFLLRPLLRRIECPDCGQHSVFFLDSSDGEGTLIKSMDHEHATIIPREDELFQRFGKFAK